MAFDESITLEDVLTFLSSIPLFNTLDPAELSEVVRVMKVSRLTDGEVAFHEGDAGDAWFVVYTGQARVLKRSRTGAWELAVLTPGAVFGEMAVLDGKPRSATVEAVGPVTLFGFRRVGFDQLLEEGSLAAYKLVLALARMLSERHRELTRRVSNLAPEDTRYHISE